jgi:hypothetical protein
VRVGSGNTELVLGPPVRKADEFDPGVCVIANKVAVRRAVGSPREDADAAVVVPADAVYLLLGDGIESEISAQEARHCV